MEPRPSRENSWRAMLFATDAAPDQWRMASVECMNVLILMTSKAMGRMTIRILLSHTI